MFHCELALNRSDNSYWCEGHLYKWFRSYWSLCFREMVSEIPLLDTILTTYVSHNWSKHGCAELKKKIDLHLRFGLLFSSLTWQKQAQHSIHLKGIIFIISGFAEVLREECFHPNEVWLCNVKWGFLTPCILI